MFWWRKYEDKFFFVVVLVRYVFIYNMRIWKFHKANEKCANSKLKQICDYGESGQQKKKIKIK